MIRWHHQLNRNETEQIPEDSEGQGNLACCSLRGCQESHTIEQLNNNMMVAIQQRFNLPLKKKNLPYSARNFVLYITVIRAFVKCILSVQ